MMKKVVWFTGLVFLIVTTVVFAGSTLDYSHMTNEELFQLRGAIQNAPEGDKEAYQIEWEKRWAKMTDEEKKQFEEPSEDSTEGNGKPRLLWTPARGYEKEGGQGQVIFGGGPLEESTGR